MPRTIRWLSLRTILAALALLAVFAIAARTPNDTDTLWHLRAGQWMVENGQHLHIDAFSHTQLGETWLNHSWLSQLTLYGLDSALGPVGLGLFTAILATGGMFFAFLQIDGDPLVRALSVVAGAGAAAVFWSPRPQMFTFFFSGAVLYVLWLWQKRDINRLWAIPLIILIWANMHGGYATGFIILVLAMIGEGVRWLLNDVIGAAEDEERVTLRPAMMIAALGLISALVTFVNPLGPRVLTIPFQTVGINTLQDFIQEWASPNFHQPWVWPFLWLLLGTYVAATVSSERLDWGDAIMLSAWAYLALLAGRNIAVFALVATPLLAEHLNAILRGFNITLRWRPPTNITQSILNGVILIALVALVMFKMSIAWSPDAIAEAQAAFPTEAANYLRDEGPPGPLFNSYNWGGYLVWELPEYPVYVDGRTDLYGDAVLSTYLNIYFAQEGWEDALDDGEINLVLVERSSPLTQLLMLHDNWQQLYRDDQAIIFARQ